VGVEVKLPAFLTLALYAASLLQVPAAVPPAFIGQKAQKQSALGGKEKLPATTSN